MSRLRAVLCLAVCFLAHTPLWAQAGPFSTPVTRLQGLRSAKAHGSFKAGRYFADGTLVLLYDQGDGLRLLKTDPNASTLLAEAQLGAAGDTGVALTLDPAGNIYVAGTSSSGQLSGTSGVALPAPADTSVNSFLAKFDANLNLVFLTFLGANRTEATALAATADAVFVTGATYSGAIPATAGSFQQTPPNSNTGAGNAFIERFTPNGTALVYATYLNGVDGGSVPSALVAGADDSVYVAGTTSSVTFPTTNALQASILGQVSGFLAQLAPDGSSLDFSTFLAGSGVASLALDPTTSSLLLTGNFASGQFPMSSVAAPFAAIPYQSLVRLSPDGQTLIDSVQLVPSTYSAVAPAASGTVWITGTLSAALSADTQSHGSGDSFVLHLTNTDSIDQFLPLGGSVLNNSTFAHLTTTLAAAAVSPDGETLTIPGTILAQTDPSLRATQALDLGLHATGTLLPNNPQDLLPATCTPGQSCSGSGGLLTQLNPGNSQAALTLSSGDLPNLTLHNQTSATATNLVASVAGEIASTCADTLAPFAQCTISRTGTPPATLSLSASDAAPLSVALPAVTASPQPLAFDADTLDFGIVTAAGSPITRTVTVTNLNSAPQPFPSTPANIPSSAPYTLAETASTCPGPASAHMLAPGASCTVTIALTASPLPQNDGLVIANWTIGSRDLTITGFAEAASLDLSASEIDFGPQPTGSSGRLPRFLYLSNNSPATIAHTPLALPPDSPFTLQDGCPLTLAANSVCQITLTYHQTNGPAFDTTTLDLDQSLSVLITGETLAISPAAPVITSPSPLLVSPLAITFANPVAVSQLSEGAQTLQITNTAALPVPLSASVVGDFTLQNSCPATLPPQQTCTLSITFVPSQPGTREGLLSLATASGNAPITIPLTGTGTSLLQAQESSINLGETVAGEPLTNWYQIQGSFPQITASASGTGFTVALLADEGNGHGTLPASAFVSSVSAPCAACWLAIRFLPQVAGTAQGKLQLASGSDGSPEQLDLQATAVPQQGLILTPVTLNFGAVPQGATSIAFTAVLTNLLADVTVASIQQINITGDFALATEPSTLACTAALQPTASCTVQVVFKPTAKGQRTGTLNVVTSSGTTTISLIGVGAPADETAASSYATTGLAVLPAQADFGPQAVDSVSTARQFLLVNTTTQTQTLAFAATRNFPLAQSPACSALAPGAACAVTVVFIPQQAGPLTGTLTITATPQDNTAVTQTVLYLRGYGTGAGTLSLSSGTTPASPVSFGNVLSGVSSTQTITLTNNGPNPDPIHRLTSTAPFQVANTTCTQTLAPGSTCAVTLTYNALNELPATATQTPHADNGTVTIEDDTEVTPLTVYLTATALASPSPVQTASLPTYTLSQSALTFPDTIAGNASPTQIITATNTGSVPVTFGDLTTPETFQANSSCTVLAPGSSCTLTVALQPSQPSTTVLSGALQLSSNAANAIDFISLLGSSFPAQLQLTPSSLDFGLISAGSSAQQSATLTNVTALPATFVAPQITGDFSVDTSNCPPPGSNLAAGQSCLLNVTFMPAASGLRSGHLTVPASSTPPTVALSGTGVAGQLQVQPAMLNFGVVQQNMSASQTLSLTNIGNAPLNGLTAAITASSAANFTFISACPVTLQAGASCTIEVLFTSSTPGQQTATLSVTSTDPSSPTLIPLTGTGDQPPGFTLSINGGTSGTSAIVSGSTATFPLLLTPRGGYTGAVHLTCTPLAAAPNATCTTADAQIDLNNAATSSSVSVITSSGLSSSFVLPLGLFSFVPWVASSRHRLRRSKTSVIALALFCAVGTLTGCGNGPAISGKPYTPPGAYQYKVTATSTATPAITQSVTLTVTVY